MNKCNRITVFVNKSKQVLSLKNELPELEYQQKVKELATEYESIINEICINENCESCEDQLLLYFSLN